MPVIIERPASRCVHLFCAAGKASTDAALTQVEIEAAGSMTLAIGDLARLQAFHAALLSAKPFSGVTSSSSSSS